MSTTKKANAGPWTDYENDACIRLYFEMLDAATIGTAYNKAAMIRAVQQGPAEIPGVGLGALGARSRGSVELKLMNCSAAHRDLRPNAVTMDGYGYRCLPNYQATLKVAMNEALANGAALTDTQKAIIEAQA